MIVLIESRLFPYYRELFHQQKLLTLLGVLLFNIVNSLFTALYAFNIAYVFTFGFAFSSVLIKVFFVQMRQLHLELGSISPHGGVQFGQNYVEYRRKYAHKLVHFFALNKMYGRVFLAILCGCAPITALMTVWVTLGQVEMEKSFFVLFFVTYGYLAMFVIHLFLTYCSRHIHRPAKSLIRLMVHSQQHRLEALRVRQLLAADIAAVHTTNLYGFTYGQFGLISLITFVKVNIILFLFLSS